MPRAEGVMSHATDLKIVPSQYCDVMQHGQDPRPRPQMLCLNLFVRTLDFLENVMFYKHAIGPEHTSHLISTALS